MVTEVLVYATPSRAATARTALRAACHATGIAARLELYSTGSLYQRLGPRHAPPLPDLVLWSGAFAAHAAALDGLLQPYQPAAVAPAAMHDRGWRWMALDCDTIGVVGSTGVSGLEELAGVPALAVADPERSEVGLSIVLATLDRARQVEHDAERAWVWWQQRVQRGLIVTEDDPDALTRLGEGRATHALGLADTGAPLAELAPLPNAVGLAASAQNTEAARRVLDWLTSDAAADVLKRSPWRAASNGLQALQSAAPPLDVEWCRQQYAPTRQRWSQSGFGPTIQP